MNSEECALWDQIVADYLKSVGTDIGRASLCSIVSAGASIADAVLDERRKRFIAVPVDGWKLAKFQISSGTCCYCDAWPVQIYQRGNVYFGCEKCTGLAPQDADAKLPGGS